VLDRRVRRLGRGGEVLLGGETFRLLRLSTQGSHFLDDLAAGAPADGAAAVALAEQLSDAGILHPVPAPRRVGRHEVDVVVPVRDDSAGAARLLALLQSDFAGGVIVVDDGSTAGEALRLDALTSASSAVLVRQSEPGGPASARNAARARSEAPFVAFLDADVAPEAGWLERLIGHFDDAGIAAVAPRAAAAGTGAVAAYEVVGSAHDLGAEPGIVGAHRRISYVPSAALVCRRRALDEVGWFDAALAVGEDVDLLRRFEQAGWVVRYEPRSTVRHDSRAQLGAFVRQRFRYGTSAAALEGRHPGSVAPFEGNRWAVAAVAAAGLPAVRRRWRVALWLLATFVPTRSLRSKLQRVGDPFASRDALRALVTAQAWTAAGLATALRRVWWPPALALALLVPRLRGPIARALAVAVVARRAPALWRASHQPDASVDPWRALTTIGLGALDDLAYGAGVWAGCRHHRSVRAVLPRVAQGTVSPPSEPRRSR
jgi:mycofactocin system glycosyltransferase